MAIDPTWSNTEVAREALRRWSAGDIDGTLETMSPEVEWHAAFPLPDLPAGKTVYRGHDEVRVLWDAFRSVWDEITLVIEEVFLDEGEKLVLSARFHARGSGSGIDLDRRIYYVMDIGEDRKLRLMQPFDTEAEARAAAGLDQ